MIIEKNQVGQSYGYLFFSLIIHSKTVGSVIIKMNKVNTKDNGEKRESNTLSPSRRIIFKMTYIEIVTAKSLLCLLLAHLEIL
jgi:hypothetical protein